MDLSALMRSKNIRSAMIVDDAYDDVPTAAAVTEDKWTVFFDDLTADEKRELRNIFPNYEEMDLQLTCQEDQFVSKIWDNKDKFDAVNITNLFEEFTTGRALDIKYLDELTRKLVNLGLECTSRGVNFAETPSTADIIFIDLFLSFGQIEDDINIAINGLKGLLNGIGRPPIVILMSRSARLKNKREEFRDKTGLFESTFRIIAKTELDDRRRLERILTILVAHYDDSIKLSNFLTIWREGLEKARDRTTDLIRKLDLADLAQINQLLLAAEGQTTGSYMVDTFDRVLLHELERDSSIIDAASALNKLTSESYPPPYVEGSKDLQDLVYRCSFQNNERLGLSSTVESRIGFGDIFRPLKSNSRHYLLTGLTTENVLMVITPACDLQNNKAKRILLLIGKLIELTAGSWSLLKGTFKTPVIEMDDDTRRIIQWEKKHLETVSATGLNSLLYGKNIRLGIIARMRESHVLELQQKALADLGRVGVLAPMPATFRMVISAYYVNCEQKLSLLPGAENLEGVCYVGREGLKNMELSLSEDTCHIICDAVESINIEIIHDKAKGAVQFLCSNDELGLALARSISLPSPDACQEQSIASPNMTHENDRPNSKVKTIGYFYRNPPMKILDEILKNKFLKNAGVILICRDDDYS